MTQFALVLGILFADNVGFQFANEKWRWMFSLTSVMALFQLLLTPFLLESPRWLLGKNANSTKARFIIKKLRGFRYDKEVETEVGHYVRYYCCSFLIFLFCIYTDKPTVCLFARQLGASKIQSLDADSIVHDKNDRNAMAEMFSDKKVRLLVVSTLVLQVANQFSG